jgi:hypothetical protein
LSENGVCGPFTHEGKDPHCISHRTHAQEMFQVLDSSINLPMEALKSAHLQYSFAFQDLNTLFQFPNGSLLEVRIHCLEQDLGQTGYFGYHLQLDFALSVQEFSVQAIDQK